MTSTTTNEAQTFHVQPDRVIQKYREQLTAAMERIIVLEAACDQMAEAMHGSNEGRNVRIYENSADRQSEE